jgi:hypothetical protein
MPKREKRGLLRNATFFEAHSDGDGFLLFKGEVERNRLFAHLLQAIGDASRISNRSNLHLRLKIAQLLYQIKSSLSLLPW